MLLGIKFLAKILAVLNGEISPRQVAAGFAAGVWVGLVPMSGLLPSVLLILFFLVNINLTILFVTAAVVKILSFLIDPLSNTIGHAVLTAPALNDFWTRLYNVPIVPYTRFNNTNVMGSFILGIILLVPMYVLGRWAVMAYRQRWREKILRWKIVQVFKTSALYRFYEMYHGLRGA